MKWFVFNAFGGLAWLAGLLVAKTANIPNGNIFQSTDINLLTGFCLGAAGLMVLIWTNLRTAG